MSKLNDLARSNQDLLLWLFVYGIGLSILLIAIVAISHDCTCREPVPRRDPAIQLLRQEATAPFEVRGEKQCLVG